MPSDTLVARAKRITVVGAAVIMCATLLGLTWTAVAKTYAFAQRVEVYISLPDWLKKVETKVDDIADEQRATNSRLDAWMRAESRRRRGAVAEPARPDGWRP